MMMEDGEQLEDSEERLGERLLGVWKSKSNAQLKSSVELKRGFVKIRFDSLFANFFPKLLVRLRYISSPVDSSRHCIVHLAERSVHGSIIGWSVACVVEDQTSNSVFVFPGGRSFDATTIVHQTIRGLLDKGFSRMSVKDVTLSVDGELYSRERLLELLKRERGSKGTPTIPFNLSFLACLFPELDSKLKRSHSSSDFSSLSLSEDQLDTLSALRDALIRFKSSRDLFDKMGLSRSLVRAIPIFRHSGLSLEPWPSILWVLGRCVMSGSLHVVGVSPSVQPSCPWEVVWRSEVTLSLFDPQHQLSPSPLSELLLSCLRFLLPDERLPDWVETGTGESVTWLGVSLLKGSISQSDRNDMAARESNLFLEERDVLGEKVQYSRDVVRGGAVEGEELARLSDLLEEVKVIMRSEFEALQLTVRESAEESKLIVKDCLLIGR
jgi:hypothetical protein